MSELSLLSILQISRLIYTNSGIALLALASNAIHMLWKWPRSDRNSIGKVNGIIVKHQYLTMYCFLSLYMSIAQFAEIPCYSITLL